MSWSLRANISGLHQKRNNEAIFVLFNENDLKSWKRWLKAFSQFSLMRKRGGRWNMAESPSD